MSTEHFLSIQEAIKEAIAYGSLIDCTALEGFSGNKLLGTLQRCARYQDKHNRGAYLEVGVFKGLSLISVASVLQNSAAFGVDDFNQFDSKGENQKTVESIIKQKRLTNIQLIALDYEDALENLSEHIGANKVATYFVDGPHDYRSQLMCLNQIRPFLAEQAVIIVDDCNYEHVRLANRDFLVCNPEYKLFFEAYTECHPDNSSGTTLQHLKNGWWNGVNIIVRDVDNLLKQQFPPTRRSRRLYLNEHLTQAHQYGVLAPDTLKTLKFLNPLRPRDLIEELRALRRKKRNVDPEFIGRFPTANTFSKGLTGGKFNVALQDICK